MLCRAVALVLAPAAIVLLLALPWNAPSGDATGTSFTPQFGASVVNSTPEARSDVSFDLSLASGDANFETLVGFLPADWGIVGGQEVLIGAGVGRVETLATLGLINSACNITLPIGFDLYNASLDQGDTVAFTDTDDNGKADYAEISDDNGLHEGVNRWPEFIFRALDETDADPIRRAAGLSVVAGVPVLLQFITFPPGTFINETIPSDEALGYPTVILLNDYGDPLTVPVPRSITDFCSPLESTTTFFGNSRDGLGTNGFPLLVNPQDGKYAFTMVSTALRDADGDGIENSLDTCPLTPNVGDPRVVLDGDLDSDGIDRACDPNDDPATGGTDSDEDADGYVNRQDNCPLAPNGEFGSNQADADLDQIGDECDPNPGDADTEGVLSYFESAAEVVVGSGSGAGGPSPCPLPGCWFTPVTTLWGDHNCSSSADPIDSLLTLRFDAGLSTNTGDCPDFGQIVDVQNASPHPWGDVDCGGEVTPVDSLKLLRFDAGLSVSQAADCPLLGSEVSVTE